jgi:hypothetical protein
MTRDVAQRWESLLERVPALRPWLAQMVRQRRAQLDGSEEELQQEMVRWLAEFEQLPPFAVTAIATTLQDDAPALPPPRAREAPRTDAPDLALDELETLLADPAFALAFHCVEVRVRPALRPAPERVPETAWFGLLHASARPQPLLTAEVAVALVLRVLGRDFARTPANPRRSALRLFHASAADLRGDLSRLCASMPREWALAPPDLPAFVAAAARARVALAEAADLCARFVRSACARGPLTGGLSLLVPAELPASAAELAELGRTAWKYGQIRGFRPLLRVFCFR